jgi:hypothetical protein
MYRFCQILPVDKRELIELDVPRTGIASKPFDVKPFSSALNGKLSML